MRALGVLLALFGGGGVVTGVMRLLQHSGHVEPIGMALLALMMIGGILLFFVGVARARAGAQRLPELAVLKVAGSHGGRVTAVLVAAEAQVPIEAAERELAALAETGACSRRSDEAGAPYFLFPEFESEEVKRKLFFADAEARRARAAQEGSPAGKVRS